MDSVLFQIAIMGYPRGKYITICLLRIPSRLSKQQKSKWPPHIQNGQWRAGGINFLLTGAENFELFHPVVFFFCTHVFQSLKSIGLFVLFCFIFSFLFPLFFYLRRKNAFQCTFKQLTLLLPFGGRGVSFAYIPLANPVK